MWGFVGMGPTEMIIVGVVAVLLFGSRLPEVARSLGKSFVEFKRGIHGMESDLNDAIYHAPTNSVSSTASTSYDDGVHEPVEPDAPKFEPPADDAKPADSVSGDSAPADSVSGDRASTGVASEDAGDTAAKSDPNDVGKTV